MKKIFTLLLTLLVAAVPPAPQASASTYTLKNKSLKLPNLYSYSNAKALKKAPINITV
ncbi:hypothetical protein [Macrococcoides goetzii]|uniref:hypothetical protein n=1 Tax=Macrococcoides goetzii TaxID=1891097 RepID=UPI001313EF4E|nr:hypothetical protein [Macrococcus goetzii]